MGEERHEHVSERFGRLLDLYRKPDGSEWGGQDLENSAGGKVTRSYVANLKKGRIENPGLAKLEAIARAMGFPPELWFGSGKKGAVEGALVGALKDETLRSILEQAQRLRPRDRRLLLSIARQIGSPRGGGRSPHKTGSRGRRPFAFVHLYPIPLDIVSLPVSTDARNGLLTPNWNGSM